MNKFYVDNKIFKNKNNHINNNNKNNKKNNKNNINYNFNNKKLVINKIYIIS
jgi:hypothetical protein